MTDSTTRIFDVTDAALALEGRHPLSVRRMAEYAAYAPANRVRAGYPATLDVPMLAAAAPSVFATRPWGGVSGRYKFVPTSHVLDLLSDAGYLPVRASESTTRAEGKRGFSRHEIRLRRPEHVLATLEVGDEIPEIILGNSHDRSSGYTLSAGLFRLVCANGLMRAGDGMGSVSVRHVGGKDFDKLMLEATHNVVAAIPSTLAQVGVMKQIELRAEERTAFAEAALEVRGKGGVTVTPAAVLSPRRREDTAPTLWNTFNAVQENLIRGDLRGKGSTGKAAKTRPVKSVAEDTRLNRALWTLAAKMAEIKGA
jgi:hypothetical protein